MLKNTIKKITLLFITIVLTSCSAPLKQSNNLSNNPADWLLVKEKLGKVDGETTFLFLDKSGATIQSVNIENGPDISYKYYDDKNKIYYRFGPGGLVSINTKTKEVKYLIDDQNINDVRISDGEFYYYENIGFVNEKYRINIRKKNSDFVLKLDYFVNDFYVKDDRIYVVNGKDDSNSKPLIRVYHGEKLEKEIQVNDIGSFYEMDNSFFYLMADSMLNLNTKELYPILENNKPIHLDNTFHAFYHIDSTFYFVNNEFENFKLYKGILSDGHFSLQEIKLNLNNVIDYEFNKIDTFTFMDNSRQFYSYNIKSDKFEKLNIPINDLNSSLLPIASANLKK